MLWFGDPCYFVPRPKFNKTPTEPLDDYDKFLNEVEKHSNNFMLTEEDMLESGKTIGEKLKEIAKTNHDKGIYLGCVQFNHSAGAGLGVVIQNFGGDGGYPVYIKIDKNGNVLEAKVVFNW